MDLVFCGTPEFAVPTLEKLAQNFNIRLVVTQPDRPRGRGLETSPSAVKLLAMRLGLAITQPGTIKNNEAFRAQLVATKPEAIVVVAYGRIIPQWMIDLPRLGNLNLHASLLPKYRGAAPIQWAIAHGEQTTGVTAMRIDAGLDTGDILLQREAVIAPDETTPQLAPRLAAIGAELMVETLVALRAGSIQARAQNHANATLAPLLNKEHGRVDFLRSAQEIYDRFRGFQPWPGAYTSFRGRMIKLVKIRPAYSAARLGPGEIKVAGDSVVVGAGEGSALEAIEVQPESRRSMPALEFVAGARPTIGEGFGS